MICYDPHKDNVKEVLRGTSLFCCSFSAFSGGSLLKDVSKVRKCKPHSLRVAI